MVHRWITSKARAKRLLLENIKNAAAWTSNSTFLRFYNNPLNNYFGNCIGDFHRQKDLIVKVPIFIRCTFNSVVYNEIVIYFTCIGCKGWLKLSLTMFDQAMGSNTLHPTVSTNVTSHKHNFKELSFKTPLKIGLVI